MAYVEHVCVDGVKETDSLAEIESKDRVRLGHLRKEANEKLCHLLRCLSGGDDLATARRFLAQISKEGMDLLQQRLT